MNKKINIVLFIVAACLLFLYPLVLFADSYALVAMYNEDNTPIYRIIIGAFIFFTLIYPLIFIVSFFLYRRKKKNIFVYLPYVNILICTLIYLLWYLLG